MVFFRLPASVPRRVRRVRPAVAAEGGVTVVETLLSAVILVIVVSAVLTTIDVSGRTASVNRSRSVAASLAEQDQERMRSLKAVSLANHSRKLDVTVDGRIYEVRSDTDFVFDDSGQSDSCVTREGQADYIRISTTVSSAVLGTRVDPVVMRGLVAPRVGSFGRDQGTLGVSVIDAAGAPVAGLPVTISGPASLTQTTNELGCAVFSRIPAGAYTATLNRLGWVDPQRAQVATKSATLSSGNTTSVEMAYAPAAGIDVSYDTKVGSRAVQPSNGIGATVVNARSGALKFPEPVAAATTRAAGLFPFTDGYTVYAGTCLESNPTTYIPAYFTSSTTVTPGAVVAQTVRQPALNLQVTHGGASAAAGVPYPEAHVIIRGKGAGCGTWEHNRGSPNPPQLTTDPAGPGGIAALADPGLPFGIYEVCADDGKVAASVTLDNTSAAGLPLLPDGSAQNKLWIDSDTKGKGRKGTCT